LAYDFSLYYEIRTLFSYKYIYFLQGVQIPSLALSILIDRKNPATDMVPSNVLTNTSPNLPPHIILPTRLPLKNQSSICKKDEMNLMKSMKALYDFYNILKERTFNTFNIQ
jgi:hypothetical protein